MSQGRAVTPTGQTYTEWQQAFDYFNRELFNNQLPYCLITLQREKHTMGYFSENRFSNRLGHKVDEIALNPSYFAVYGVNEALQTLGHEMCHQWQHRFGKPGRARYHNKEWSDKMESIGLMPSTTGRPGGRRTGDKMSDYIIDGGVFERAVEGLKADGFELIWIDRFVAPPMGNDAPQYVVATQQAGVEIPELMNDQDDDAFDIDEDTQAEIGMLSASVDLDFTRVVQKQGTRMKYCCECGINLWAKPGIDVTCNNCETRFNAVTN